MIPAGCFLERRSTVNKPTPQYTVGKAIIIQEKGCDITVKSNGGGDLYFEQDTDLILINPEYTDQLIEILQRYKETGSVSDVSALRGAFSYEVLGRKFNGIVWPDGSISFNHDGFRDGFKELEQFLSHYSLLISDLKFDSPPT